MTYLQRLEHWGDTHHPKWLDILRIALGLFLCFKGVEFANNMNRLMGMMTTQVPFSSFTLTLLSHHILFAHLLGGVLMTVGLLTRFAALIQIPVLLGAIVFINTSPDIMGRFSEIFFSIVILLLLVYFLIVGSGPWSIDAVMKKEQKD